MNLFDPLNDLPSDLADFAETARRSCEAAAGLPPAEAARRLAEDGLTGVIAPEPFGLDLPLTAALPVLRAAGAARLSLPLGAALAASHLLSFLPKAAAEALVDGRDFLTAAPVADVSVAGGRSTSGDAPHLSGRAGHVPLADAAGWLLVPVGASLAFVDLAAGGIAVKRASVMDEARPSFVVDLDAAAAVSVEDPEAVAEYRARADLFQAIDASAGAAAAMALAVGHLTDRSQFGQPLIGFQSLRHDLARARMELHSLDRLIARGLAAETLTERTTLATMARARAAAHMPGIVEMALHMHGGMGFTRNVPVHEWLRRLRAGIGPAGPAEMNEAVAARVLALP